jgi:tRNA(Ile)-lysidine synthase
MNIEQRVQTFIHSHGLFTDDSALLVALSGGADSVVLLRLLLRLGYRCHAVHCNFHLRGEESLRDEHFVTELCQALGVPCEVVHFDTTSYAAQHKLSIEMAARELRYREFERIRHERSLDAIAVAHHQDDAVETLLLNLIRGAGINGLTGMKVRNGHVVRPLLSLTRQEIIDYLDRLGQPYVTDSTNLTDEYARNKISGNRRKI